MPLYRNIGAVQEAVDTFEDAYPDFPRVKYPVIPIDDSGSGYPEDLTLPVPDERPKEVPEVVSNTALIEDPGDGPGLTTGGGANLEGMLTLGGLVLTMVAPGRGSALVFGGLMALLAYRLK